MRAAKKLNPKLLVIARTAYVRDADAVQSAGASRVVVAEAEVALAMTEADRALLQHGDAREEIARRTRSGRYDAVAVIGSGSRIARWLFGSVTRAVLRGAEVDTLLL